jgi:hypothetical protein
VVARHDPRAEEGEPSRPRPVVLPSIDDMPPHGESQSGLVPDLRGMGARDAIRTLARLGLATRIHGTGVVVTQTPAPGTPLERGLTCTLVLDRDLSRLNGAGGEQP